MRELVIIVGHASPVGPTVESRGELLQVRRGAEMEPLRVGLLPSDRVRVSPRLLVLGDGHAGSPPTAGRPDRDLGRDRCTLGH
jgi:hypothetical protein